MIVGSPKSTTYVQMLSRHSEAVRPKSPATPAIREESAKRLKLSRDVHMNAFEIDFRMKEQPTSDASSSCHWHHASREIPDSDGESGPEAADDTSMPPIPLRGTDLEHTLPPIDNDRDAIEEYEASKAAEANSESSSQLHQRLDQGTWKKGKSSIYVDAFNLALGTVLNEESHLFDLAEMAVFEAWKALSYEAQYLYVRLFLRKTAAWHRINKIGYYRDIGNMNIALKELFAARNLSSCLEVPRVNYDEFAPSEKFISKETFTFADASENHVTSVEEASSLLMLDELKAIAKEAKLQGRNKQELLHALRRYSGTQTSLSLGRHNTSAIESSCVEGHDQSYSDVLDPLNGCRKSRCLQRIMSEIGQCVRLSAAPYRLFERVHLVFYRSTEWTEKSLTTMILARISRRNFPDYIVSRSSNIFASRSVLLEFEDSLRSQFRVDEILEFHGTPSRESLQEVVDIFEKTYPRWEALLEEEQRKEDSLYESGEGAYLRRLSPAWVYTRIVHKGAYVLGLGKFKDHAREHCVLSKLLSQRLFHSSRRGAWYQRKALLEEHYMAALTPAEGRSKEEQKKNWKRIALRTCEQGLEDNLVHLIYHYDLQKRVLKLEKALKVPRRLQHEFGHNNLLKPTIRLFEGIRIEHSLPSNLEVPTNDRRNVNANLRLQSTRRGKRTSWLDPAPDSQPGCEVTVEAMCLSQYRSLGWKGYHSEGSVLRTLFALLFYDIIFTYVPNVFQTPYQTCPLDLHTDAFFASRMSEINARLADIANGLGERIIVEVWEREYERKTCVIGLDWGFELNDLRAIVVAFGGDKLATICKTLAQEYAQRGGGIPDLFLWRDGTSSQSGEVLFVEVKSENDRLSDTQRLWIHVLTSAGMRVELCNAVAKEVRLL